ncbi:FAD-dependent monooxygenase [Paraburkholderia sp. SARCC-3016]|uniref:FAD-dependent oxidoreductase n=1 Tax=Paraburkholderia sp. SARCC-3016 TaxID=3058611 RepID=UPI002809DB83|nr:FAD-dependent monooxygenase [Paraburkholderia sp. SARCC-3016]MDQ7978292.1 FAD-dependent monooxygenase [Paraburkholderia sp. SARCC-3016]
MGKPRIAVIGAGLGGTVAAALLQRNGAEVTVYERAPGLSRNMDGVHLSPNAMKVMRRIGCERELNEIGARPNFWISRDAESGQPIAQISLDGDARGTYGAAYLTMRRSDLHDVLAKAIAPGSIRYDKCLRSVEDVGSEVRMTFTDNSVETADLLVAADGAASRVRNGILDVPAPRYSGYVAHRWTLPASLLNRRPYDMCVKWCAHDRHLLIYNLTSARSEYHLVTRVPQEIWPDGITAMSNTRDEMREAFAEFHPNVLRLMEISPTLSARPLLHQDPSAVWSCGRLVLIGNACHPMKSTPQATAMAIEDAAMLARCLNEAGVARHEHALALYRANRVERTSKAQRLSRKNAWMRDSEDLSWFYGYDVFDAPLIHDHAHTTADNDVVRYERKADTAGAIYRAPDRHAAVPAGALAGLDAQISPLEAYTGRP